MNGACTVSHSTVRMQYKAKPIHTIILEHGPLIIHGLGRVLVAYLIGACLRSQHPGFFPPPTRVMASIVLKYLSGPRRKFRDRPLLLGEINRRFSVS